MRVNYDEGRPDPNSLHGRGLAADWPGDNFPIGQELWGLQLIAEISDSYPGLTTIPKPEPSVVQPPAEGITDANNNSFVMSVPGTPGYGNTAPVEEESKPNPVLSALENAANFVLPGNFVNLDGVDN